MKKLPIEGNRLEYKETAKHGLPRSIWESVSAFANTAGGKIILGVSEVKKNKEFNVIGVADPNKLKIDFLNLQNDKSTISQAVVGSDDVEVETVEGKEIVVIKVPKVSYKKRPIYIKGNIKKTFYRDHEADRQASDELLRYFLRESDTTTDSELLSGFDLDDLDLVSLQNYKVFLSQQSQEDEYLTKNFSEFLKMIGLMQRNRALKDKKWQLTKAALLLFGKYNSIIEVFPKFFLDFIVKRNSSDVDYLDRIYTSNEAHHPQNIYSFFEQTFQKIQSQLDNKFELDGINRKDNGEVLLAAVREGLVNCLIHADYSAESQIKISLFKDFIEFSNPGEMRVTKDRYILGGESEARNPKIFAIFTRAKLGERTGSGGHRIYQTADKLKLRAPEITTTAYTTELSIWLIPLSESVLEGIPSAWQSTYKRMSSLLIASYANLKDLYKNSYEGHKILNEMVEAGLLEKSGKNKGTKYSLAQSDPAIRMSVNKLIRQFQTDFLND